MNLDEGGVVIASEACLPESPIPANLPARGVTKLLEASSAVLRSQSSGYFPSSAIAACRLMVQEQSSRCGWNRVNDPKPPST